jgi:PAS domain S-box-containing protein
MATKPTYEELEHRVKYVAQSMRTLRALEDSEEKYRNVVENAHDGIAIIQDGRFKFVNQRLAQMAGYAPDEVIDTPFDIHIDPAELPEAVDFYKRRMAGEQLPERYDRGLRHKNGSRIDVEIVGGLIPYQGKPADLVVIRDVTDRKNMEKALKESEENFRGIFENMVDVYYRANLEGNLMAVSPSGVRLLGYDSSEEMIGKNIAKEFYANPQDREYLRSEIMKHGKITFEGILKRKDGTLIVTETNSRVVYDEGGKPVAIEGMFRDVTERKRLEEALQIAREELEMQVEERTAELVVRNKELEAEIISRKQAEEALRESEEKYKLLYDNAVVAMFRTAIEDGKGLAANDVGVHLLGYSSKEEFLSQFKTSEHYVDPDGRKRLLDALKKGPVDNFEVELSRKDGSTFWAEFSAKMYLKEGYLEGAVIDITKRKQAEEALQDQTRYRIRLNALKE